MLTPPGHGPTASGPSPPTGGTAHPRTANAERSRVPRAPAATAASASAPLVALREGSPGSVAPRALERKHGNQGGSAPTGPCANPTPTLEHAPPPTNWSLCWHQASSASILRPRPHKLATNLWSLFQFRAQTPPPNSQGRQSKARPPQSKLLLRVVTTMETGAPSRSPTRAVTRTE